MSNYADRKTEKSLAELEADIKKEYSKAYAQTVAKWKEYIGGYDDASGVHHNSLKERYDKEYKAYKAGKYTEQEFNAWYAAQIARGKRWEQLKDELAQRITDANITASGYINDKTPSIFAENANYTAYELYKHDKELEFTIYDEDSVRNLLQEQNNNVEFKTTSVNPKRDYAWNKKQIQSAVTSGILQGKSIDGITDSFLTVMKRNKASATRNARTAVTSAQNNGRISRMYEAQEMGINVKKKWLSASDGRVRDSHAHLNGQIRAVDKAFDNGLMFPADSDGAPAEVYNCRCTLTYILPDYEDVESNETYKDWLKERTKKQEKENG